MRRLAVLVAVFLVLVACERPYPTGAEVSPRPAREAARGLLQVELELEALANVIEASATPNSQDRRETIKFLRSHVARCAGWLASVDQAPEHLVAAHVGLDLAGVGYDLARIDLAATWRSLDGLARQSTNSGLDAVFRAVRVLERAPSEATSEDVTADLLLAVAQRDKLLRTLPIANALRAGVQAASIVSGAYSLAAAVRAAGAPLQRMAAFLAGPGRAAAMLDVAAGSAAIRLVSTGGTLVLTEAEVISLAQAGVLSTAAVQLYMMSSGRPPKVPNPRAFADWIEKAPTRAPQVPDAEHAKFQVKYAGPEERLVRASSGEEVWADGGRAADCRLLEAKYVGDPSKSPFVSASNPVHERIRNLVREQFQRYAAIIRDLRSPAVSLEVITNDSRAVPFFEALLKDLGIPGEVVVRPYP